MFTVNKEGWFHGSAGLTGVLLLLILLAMFVLSQPFVRKRGFFEVGCRVSGKTSLII